VIEMDCVCGRAGAVGSPEPVRHRLVTPIRLALQRGPPGCNQRSRNCPTCGISPGRCFAQVHPSREPLAAALRHSVSVRMASRVLASSRSIRLRIAHSHKLLLRAAAGHNMNPATAAGP
jgi:hypothetical protein